MRKSAYVAQQLAAKRTTAHAPAPRSEEQAKLGEPHWTKRYLKQLANAFRRPRRTSASLIEDARIEKAAAKRSRKNALRIARSTTL
jgi:hypothetical protein